MKSMLDLCYCKNFIICYLKMCVAIISNTMNFCKKFFKITFVVNDKYLNLYKEYQSYIFMMYTSNNELNPFFRLYQNFLYSHYTLNRSAKHKRLNSYYTKQFIFYAPLTTFITVLGHYNRIFLATTKLKKYKFI